MGLALTALRGSALRSSSLFSVLLALAISAVAVLLVHPRTAARSLSVSDLRDACQTDNPYLVTVCYPSDGGLTFGQMTDFPNVVVLRDTPDDLPQYSLARNGQVGALWGLAYDASDGTVYAGAYHKRGASFGPGGPGAIYRLDVATGAVDVALTVPNAGPDRHDVADLQWDLTAADWVGKTGLGDIDLGDDGASLFVVNLADRYIYRFRLPDGHLLNRFAHGASGEPWADDARPFALAHHDGWLYHGVVRTAESTGRRAELRALIYRSRSTGGEMQLVADLPLDYDRGQITQGNLRWLPWRGGLPAVRPQEEVVVYPMPMLVDLVFDRNGNLILGLRDRTGDMRMITTGVTEPIAGDKPAYALGDLLRSAAGGGGFELQPDFYRDSLLLLPHSTTGGLAELATTDVVAAGGFGLQTNGRLGRAVSWYENVSGARIATEIVQPYLSDWIPGPPTTTCKVPFGSPGLGDVEMLCGPTPALPTPPPTSEPTPTLTGAPPTGSPTPSLTATPGPSPTTSPVITPTTAATPRVVIGPVYLPIALREQCVPGAQGIDVALVIDASTTMRNDQTSAGRTKLSAAIEAATAFVRTMSLPQDQAAVLVFNDKAEVLQELTGWRADIEAALVRIPSLVRLQTRIDLGIEEAHKELTSGRRKPANRQVMIVLTDGLANPEPASTAVRRAQAAKDDHITIFTIGVGREGDLNFAELQQMASRPAYFYLAPDGEDLLAIYRTIAVEIPCPAESFWGWR